MLTLMNQIVRIGLVVVVILLLASSGYLAFSVQQAVSGQASKSFSDDADAVTDAISGRMDNYNDLLYQGRSLMASASPPNQDEWVSFFGDQQILVRYGGISSVAYVERFGEQQKAAFVATMRQQPQFGGSAFGISPESTEGGNYAVASRVYSATDQSGIYGFNVLSSAERRAVYAAADQSSSPITSPPLVLRSGYQGFFMVLAVKASDARIKGYVVISFRMNEFARALVIPAGNVRSIRLRDATQATMPKDLYGSKYWNEDLPIKHVSSLSVGGRAWQIEYTASPDYDGRSFVRLAPALIAFNGVLLASVIMLVTVQLLKRPVKE